MACLRESPLEGRFRIVQCDEEGCKFRQVATIGGGRATASAPEIDCVLQLRLRAGDAEDSVERDSADGAGDPDGGFAPDFLRSVGVVPEEDLPKRDVLQLGSGSYRIDDKGLWLGDELVLTRERFNQGNIEIRGAGHYRYENWLQSNPDLGDNVVWDPKKQLFDTGWFKSSFREEPWHYKVTRPPLESCGTGDGDTVRGDPVEGVGESYSKPAVNVKQIFENLNSRPGAFDVTKTDVYKKFLEQRRDIYESFGRYGPIQAVAAYYGVTIPEMESARRRAYPADFEREQREDVGTEHDDDHIRELEHFGFTQGHKFAIHDGPIEEFRPVYGSSETERPAGWNVPGKISDEWLEAGVKIEPLKSRTLELYEQHLVRLDISILARALQIDPNL